MTTLTQGFAIWLTGLPAAGKSSLAREMEARLAARGIHCIILDSDELREVLTPDPAYTEEERNWFYGVLGYLAAWLARNGVNVLVAATGHRRAYRDAVRERVDRFAEVYVRCPLAVCKMRDPKRIYEMAASGRANNVPGIDAPYDTPRAPEATVDTDKLTPADAAATAVSQLEAEGIISPTPT